MLDLRKTLALLFLLPACSFPAFSQRPDSFWGKIVDMISAPSMELDPSAVYQPAARWNVAVSGELHQRKVACELCVQGRGHLFLGPVFIDVSGSYDSYNYRGSTDIPQVYSDSDVDFDKIQSSGRFSRWSASLKLCVKL